MPKSKAVCQQCSSYIVVRNNNTGRVAVKVWSCKLVGEGKAWLSEDGNYLPKRCPYELEHKLAADYKDV